MTDILDEAQSLLQCKSCPWYKNCILPVRVTENDLKKQLEPMTTQATYPGTMDYNLNQLLSGLASAAENSILEGCPVFINRLKSNPAIAQRIKRMMQEWSKESNEQTP